ncbi:MAG: NADH:ubiquinone reductase (Na(+)-transporting) subunit F [Desulfobacterales bacterium]|nr:NADH:ubiquinone reductase (Na(+)-transporting) subunit F [Desulfobacterales bacterium]
MIYIVSTTVFSSVIFLLVVALLLVEAKVVRQGDSRIVINDDPDKGIETPIGKTLLAALVNNDILIASACGGKGTCGTCKCVVTEGGGDVLPTELAHLSRQEKADHVRLACQLKVKQDLSIRIPEEIFSIRKLSATVVSNRNVATFIKELVLQLDDGQTLEFDAGAYVQIDIPEYTLGYDQIDVADRYRAAWEKFNLWQLRAASDETVNRAYSLASAPAENDRLMFTIRIATPPPGRVDLPPGIGSSYVFGLNPGDRVTLSGPYGDFFVRDTDREMCFIGGGAGMAPMRSHIFNQLLAVGTRRKMTFWYGARSRQEMFYDEEFSDLANRFDNFTYHVALSEPQPEDDWDGPVGFIHQVANDLYLTAHPDPDEIEYYLCGPPMMIQAVMKMIDSLGVDREMISFDDFG